MDKEDVVHIYNRVPLSHEKREQNNAICSNRMDLEIAILRHVSHTEKNKYHMISFIYGIEKKKVQMNLSTRYK